MHHLLPNSEFYQLRMSTSIAGFFPLSYASVVCKNNSEGIIYMYTYPFISIIHAFSLPNIWNLHWHCCSTALLQMSNWELSGLCKLFLNAWTNDNNVVFEIAVSSSVCLWYLQPEKKLPLAFLTDQVSWELISFSSLLSENVFILPSFLKDPFMSYRILVWQVFIFLFFFSLLNSLVSDKKFTVFEYFFYM